MVFLWYTMVFFWLGKLLDQVMKVFERVIERKMRNLVSLDDMQFEFRPGKS